MRPLTSPNSNFTRSDYPPISTDGRIISPGQAQRELFSAIEFASDVDFPSLCEKAISNGAQVNSTDAQGKTSIQSAIESGSVIKLRYLCARYAQLPEVNQNGTNILMLAATEDHADIVQFLIDEANMDFNAVDAKGISALHFAVINEGIATIKILLKCQANPNQLTNSLEKNDLERMFGKNFNTLDCLKNAKHISPLMIATALNNHEAVSLLIDHHANVQLGAIPPLLIAIKNNNERMIAILSQAQARAHSYQHPIQIDISLITYAINNNISAPCLQCLLNENSKYIQIDQAQIFDLFKIFIQKNRPDCFALFLAAGIDVNDDNAYKYLMKLSQNSSNKNIFFNLLAYRNANEFEKKIESKKPIVKIFDDLEKERSILTLLAKGMFQTVANIIYQVYLETKTGNPINNIEQVNFAICLKLVPENLLHQEIFPDFFLSQNGKHLAPEWLNIVKSKAQSQLSSLQVIAKKNIDQKNNQFQGAFSINYLENFVTSDENAHEIGNQFCIFFTKTVGLRDNLATFFTQYFKLAFNFTLPLKSQNYTPNEIASLTQKIIINLLKREKLNAESEPDSVNSEIIKKLTIFLNEKNDHLTDFFKDPFISIKKLENRRDLRPPELTAFQKQLSLNLGLPSQFCQYIAKAWSNSILKTRLLNQLNTPSAIIQAHKNQFSLSLLDELDVLKNDTQIMQVNLLENACLQLKKWCFSLESSLDSIQLQADSRENDGRNPKRLRLQ